MDIIVFLNTEGSKPIKRSDFGPLIHHQNFLDKNCKILPTTKSIFTILSILKNIIYLFVWSKFGGNGGVRQTNLLKAVYLEPPGQELIRT